MGGKGSGRLSVTDSILKKTTQNFTPIASGEMFLPNHSGDHTAGTTGTPDSDFHIANKKYVDDSVDLISTKKTTMFNQSSQIDVGLIGEVYIKIGETQTSANKGLTMIRDGSVTGISINYDCVGVAKIAGFSVVVKKNGVNVWTNGLVTTTGINKIFVFTQDRNTDTFEAEDVITVAFSAIGVVGTIDIENVIAQVEYYYDEVGITP